MTKKLAKIALPTAAIAAVVLPMIAMAQPNVPNAPFNDINSIIATNGLICRVFRYLFFFLVLLTVIFIVLAAFKYLTAGGDPEKVKNANYQIVYAAIALVIALLARVLPGIVSTFVGGGTIATC